MTPTDLARLKEDLESWRRLFAGFTGVEADMLAALELLIAVLEERG